MNECTNCNEGTTATHTVLLREGLVDICNTCYNDCEKVAMDQLLQADAANAMKNLERMVYALSRVGITNEREGKDNG